MTITCTASLKSDVNFTLIETGSNTRNESGGLSYSRSISNGVGSLQANYGVVSSGELSAYGKQRFDFRSLAKNMFGLSANVQFSKIKSITIENQSTGTGEDINVHATGTYALSGLFNSGSGNLLIKPYATYMYSDPISGLPVTAATKELTIQDVSGSGAPWTMIVVGVTG